jgi:ATP-binding protein involved in chromosome partitioning
MFRGPDIGDFGGNEWAATIPANSGLCILAWFFPGRTYNARSFIADGWLMASNDSLDRFADPYLGDTWKSLGVLRRVEQRGSALEIDVQLGYPAAGIAGELQQRLSEAVGRPVALSLSFEAPSLSAGPNLPGVKNIVAVASGKGGVGKSTTAVNLALALSREGARVGILDADIYGPSLGIMLGVPAGKRPEVKDEKYFVPIKAHGLQSMSMSFLVTKETPMVWRGPMASSALTQMLGQTLWDRLDYLVVDMPPGTGDIQLTLSQRAKIAGAVIVTTPQDIALQDAAKGIEMFRKVDVPVLGIIENMGLHVCPECGHQSHIFGAGGGERIAKTYGTALLATLPLAMEIREQADSGAPTVAVDPDGVLGRAYRDGARHLAARLWQVARGAAAVPQISMTDD